jgi:DedD protein
MDEKNDLNDILIKSNDKGNEGNFKNWILSIAGVLIIFIMGMLLFQLISEETPKKDSESTILPPVPPSEPTQELFEELPVGELSDELEEQESTEAKESLDAMIRRIKEQKSVSSEPEEPAMDKLAKESIEESQPLPPVETKVNPTPVETVVETPKKVEPVPVKKAEVKPVKKVTKKVAPKKQYYAQVASLTKYAPNKKFLKSIKTAGYEYKIVEKNVKGIQVKRVYVGPFNSRGKANLELDNIRAKISTSAYVVKD